MPQQPDVLYGENFVETATPPSGVDPATYRRDFAFAKDLIRQAVPPGKKASKSFLVRLIRGWRADNTEVIPLIPLRKRINKIDQLLETETDTDTVAQLNAEKTTLVARIQAARPPNFADNPILTYKRLRNNLSISGPLECKSLTVPEIESLIDEVIAERLPSWTFLPVEEPPLP